MKTKIIPLILLSALLLGIFSSCHGSRGMAPFSMPDGLDDTRTYEINFWAKNDTNKTQTDIYQRAIDGFEELYPNITVNLRLYTDYSKIYNDVITNISTGTTPNVCITYPDHIATYTTGSNVVVPLDALMTDAQYGLGGSKVKFDSPTADEIIPKFLSECRLGNTYYALPYMRSTEACYINKTYVEALGYTVPDVLTWDFIWEVSEAAAAKDANGTYLVNGQKVMIPFIYKSTDNMMITMLRQKNAAYSSEDGSIGIFNSTTDALLTEIAGHVQNGAFSTFKISGYPANFLNAGQCIFAIDSTAGATWMGTDAPLVDIAEDRLVEFETVVRAVPQFDTENPQMISQGPSICIFNKEDSEEVLASWLFAQYLLTNDIQIAYAQTEGYAPVTSKAQNSPEYRDYLSREGEDNELYYDIKLKATKLLLEQTENTFVTPVFNGSASLRTAAGQLIENVTKATRRKETVDTTYLNSLYQETSSLYRLRGGGQMNITEQQLGDLPTLSVVLLCSLGAAWLIMGFFAIRNAVKEKKRQSASHS